MDLKIATQWQCRVIVFVFAICAGPVFAQTTNPTPPKVDAKDQQPGAQALGPIAPFVIAGGGGASSGGSFALTGTIGQSAAVPTMTGGSFSVSSGFWNATDDGAPVLKKRRGQTISQ